MQQGRLEPFGAPRAGTRLWATKSTGMPPPQPKPLPTGLLVALAKNRGELDAETLARLLRQALVWRVSPRERRGG